MKYFLIAGEASGDLHGSNLVKGLRKRDADSIFSGWGGPLMQNEGMTLLKHYKELAFMGIAEVIVNIHTILSNFRTCKSQIIDYKPDALILVDYPGFNLRIAKWAKSKGIKVYYYISPTVWAWHESRIQTIRKSVDRLFAILPFEPKFYADRGINIEYFGHPLIDSVSAFRIKPVTELNFRHDNKLDERPIIALLAGSRKQELKRILPIMLEVSSQFPGYQFVIAGAPGFNSADYAPYLSQTSLPLVFSQTYTLLQFSVAALVTSGTATLETALIGTPQIVCYRTSLLSYIIGKMVIKLKFISLVNLILNKEVVKELIQFKLNPKNLTDELMRILPGGANRNQIECDYQEISEILGKPGASDRVAERIFSLLTSTS
jgi:lipid-A-disaccharide synthase